MSTERRKSQRRSPRSRRSNVERRIKDWLPAGQVDERSKHRRERQRRRIPDRRLSGCKEEYMAAISLMQFETQLYWVLTGVFMLPLTVLLGFIGQTLIEDLCSIRSWPIRAGAILGVALCVLWFAALARSASFQEFRIAQARVRERYLKYGLMSEGWYLAVSGSIEYDGQTFKIPRVAQLLRMKTTIRVLALIFGATFGAVLLFGL